MGKVICTKCKKFVDYSIEYKQEKTTIKEKEVTYLKAEAHCKECGANVWVGEVEAQNILAFTNQANDFVKLAQKQAIKEFVDWFIKNKLYRLDASQPGAYIQESDMKNALTEYNQEVTK